jgi:hypothetical protein
LTYSSRATLELVATDAGELTGSSIIVAITGALHVTILWSVELATASDCRTQAQRSLSAEFPSIEYPGKVRPQNPRLAMRLLHEPMK